MSAAGRLRDAVRAAAAADGPDTAAAAWARYATGAWLTDLDELASDDDALAILTALRSVAGMGRTADTHARVLRDRAAKAPRLRLVRDDEPAPPLRDALVRAGLADCPEGVAMPDGHRLTPEGIVRESDEDRVVIAHAPILIIGAGEDTVTGHRYLRLAWRTPGGGWVRRSVDRSIVMQTRRIVELADQGAPVTSVSAAAVVQYLAAQEAASAGRLPLLHVARTPGWYDDGAVYLLGGDVIAADGADTGWTLEPSSEGDAQWYDHIGCSGDFVGWLRAWLAVERHPRAALAVYLAVCPMLRGIIPEMPGAMAEWAGRTSGGKSITLELAASVYGSPDLIRRWDTTAVGAEVAAAAARDMPLMMDDTKALLSGGSERRREQGAATITATIYLATGAKGRQRGAKEGGSRRQADVRTWLLSTAETPSVDLAHDVGIRPRTLTITGRPLGDDPVEGGRAAALVSSLVRAHHGHLATRCARWLCEAANAEQVREWFRAHRAAASAGGDSIEQRLAMLIASVQTAQDVCEAVGVPRHPGIIDAVIEAASYSLRAAQTHRAALQALWGATTAQGRILGASDSERRTPSGGWVGETRSDGTVALIEAQARREMRALGYDLTEMVDQWRAEGWLRLTGKGAVRTTVTVGGYRTAGYILTAAGAEAAAGDGDA